MLHVTTDVGKPGRKERERKHFPCIYNKPSEPEYQPTGRRYIPHFYSKSDDWRPHNLNQQPKYTCPGPDWSSKLRWLPHPKNPQYPAEELWPVNWHSIRKFPWTYKTTAHDQKPLPLENMKGKRCNFSGIHRATTQTSDEVKDFRLKRSVTDLEKRNGIFYASPGDKVYQAVEYSSQFHRQGSTLPIPNFSGNNTRPVDTFIPLEKMPAIPREPFHILEKRRKEEEERTVVQSLDTWRPATPIQNML